MILDTIVKHEIFLDSAYRKLFIEFVGTDIEGFHPCQKCYTVKYHFQSNDAMLWSTQETIVKILKNGFCFPQDLPSLNFGQLECVSYMEKIVPKVLKWFQSHIRLSSEKEVCKDYCPNNEYTGYVI